MAVLSIWFWLSVFVGGVLTIDAPYMARLVGIIPTLAIFAAVPLNKISAEFVEAVGQFGARPLMRRVGQGVAAVGVTAILLYLFGQNYSDYYFRYMVNWPVTEVTGQAYFVRQMDQTLAAQGKPTGYFYDLGIHFIYWGHGDNRFLNHGIAGQDMTNPSNELPILNNGDKDAIFMIWDLDRHYGPVIQTYYPNGVIAPFYYSPNQSFNFLFNSFRVTKEQIDAPRYLLATYTPASGPAIQREEHALGPSLAPPGGLTYPATAAWTGGLVAPAFGRYAFRLDSPAPAELTIDGLSVVSTTETAPHGTGEVILARGPHDVALRRLLPAPTTPLSLVWSVGGTPYAGVPRAYLWSGPGKGLLGTVRQLDPSVDGLALQQPPPSPTDNVFMRRIDGFLGFRDAASGLSNGGAAAAAWTGTLNIAQPGSYSFDTFSNGDSALYIDSQPVVNNRTGTSSDPHSAVGTVTLDAGPHQIDVRYTWLGGYGYLEVFWTPPGAAQHLLISPDVLHADGGAWRPGTVREPSYMQMQTQLGVPPRVVQPARVLAEHDNLLQPRGLAVDAAGRLYVADAGNHRVVVFANNGTLLRTIGSAGTGDGQFTTPEDVDVAPDGTIYVLDSAMPASLQAFAPDGHFLRRLGAGALCSPAGMGLGPDGSVYVANTCAGQVLKFTPDGTLVAQLTGGAAPATTLDQPVDVVAAADGTIFVADLRHRVVQLTPTGAILNSWPVPVGGNLGAANITMLQGLVYLSDPDRNVVDLIDPTTNRQDSFGSQGTDPGEFSEPTGIAGGPDGQLYVMDSDTGRIQVFPPLAPQQP